MPRRLVYVDAETAAARSRLGALMESLDSLLKPPYPQIGPEMEALQAEANLQLSILRDELEDRSPSLGLTLKGSEYQRKVTHFVRTMEDRIEHLVTTAEADMEEQAVRRATAALEKAVRRVCGAHHLWSAAGLGSSGPGSTGNEGDGGSAGRAPGDSGVHRGSPARGGGAAGDSGARTRLPRTSGPGSGAQRRGPGAAPGSTTKRQPRPGGRGRGAAGVRGDQARTVLPPLESPRATGHRSGGRGGGRGAGERGQARRGQHGADAGSRPGRRRGQREHPRQQEDRKQGRQGREQPEQGDAAAAGTADTERGAAATERIIEGAAETDKETLPRASAETDGQGDPPAAAGSGVGGGGATGGAVCAAGEAPSATAVSGSQPSFLDIQSAWTRLEKLGAALEPRSSEARVRALLEEVGDVCDRSVRLVLGAFDSRMQRVRRAIRTPHELVRVDEMLDVLAHTERRARWVLRRAGATVQLARIQEDLHALRKLGEDAQARSHATESLAAARSGLKRARRTIQRQRTERAIAELPELRRELRAVKDTKREILEGGARMRRYDAVSGVLGEIAVTERELLAQIEEAERRRRKRTRKPPRRLEALHATASPSGASIPSPRSRPGGASIPAGRRTGSMPGPVRGGGKTWRGAGEGEDDDGDDEDDYSSSLDSDSGDTR